MKLKEKIELLKLVQKLEGSKAEVSLTQRIQRTNSQKSYLGSSFDLFVNRSAFGKRKETSIFSDYPTCKRVLMKMIEQYKGMK